MNRKTARTQKRPNLKRQTVQLTLWVNPLVKEELQRIVQNESATGNKLTISTVGARILERGLQHQVDMQYGTLLEPIIRQEIRRQMYLYSSRIALLLVRNAFASEQTRNLTANILGRQPGITPDILDHLLDSSAQGARQKIMLKSPQLEKALKEVETWLTEELGKE
jgi:hypothetical protein